MATDHRRRHDDEQRSALRRALIFPPPARNPFVHVLALGALGQGVGIVLGNPSPGSIETVLPHPLLYVWGLGLIGVFPESSGAGEVRGGGEGGARERDPGRRAGGSPAQW
jgi:hypothetical protein